MYWALLNQHRQKALHFEKTFTKFRKQNYQNTGRLILKCETFRTQRKLRFEFAEANNVEDSFDRTARYWEFFGCNTSFKTANFFLRSPQSGKPRIQQGSS